MGKWTYRRPDDVVEGLQQVEKGKTNIVAELRARSSSRAHVESPE